MIVAFTIEVVPSGSSSSILTSMTTNSSTKTELGVADRLDKSGELDATVMLTCSSSKPPLLSSA